MSLFISDALAQATGADSGAGDPLISLLPLVLFAVVFYFLLIRPQAKRQKEHKRMVDSLSKGDEVVTMGGVAGRITDIGESFAMVEVADGVQIKVSRSAIETILPKGSLKEL
jgi:preprotein translocase subunit YajC